MKSSAFERRTFVDAAAALPPSAVANLAEQNVNNGESVLVSY